MFNTMSQRIKYLIKISYKNSNIMNKSNEKNVASNNKIIWFMILFINNISDKFKRIINNTVFKIAFYSINKFRSLIKVQKDSLQTSIQRTLSIRLPAKIARLLM